jgi:hypothetical protein
LTDKPLSYSEILTKKEFENSKEPLTLILSFNPKTEKVLFSYFDGYDNDYLLEKFKKDFPDMFHFIRGNISAKRKFAKEVFNYDI